MLRIDNSDHFVRRPLAPAQPIIDPFYTYDIFLTNLNSNAATVILDVNFHNTQRFHYFRITMVEETAYFPV
jgi:hypothetical protein